MSPARKASEEPEPDRVEGQAHPRETYDLIGQDAALARAARAIRSGLPPQAWLISGPPGIGKATLAYRIARYLLRFGATDTGPADLSVPPKDAVCRQIEAQSQPGLLVLRRQLNEKTGKLKTVLEIDEIRRLGAFFGLTSAAGGWRIAIVDSADEMNDNAANALLKILEEPPPKGIVLLLSHAPGRLLPTIRSRCQRLDLKPLDEASLAVALARLLPEAQPADRAALAHLAEGSLGLALRLAGGDELELARAAETLLEQRLPDVPALVVLGDRVSRAQDGLLHFGQFLTEALSRRIRRRAQGGQGDARAVALWERVSAHYNRAVGLHLEPRQTVMSSALVIATAKRRGAI
jgi:DNA polymerase III subunit delta'